MCELPGSSVLKVFVECLANNFQQAVVDVLMEAGKLIHLHVCLCFASCGARVLWRGCTVVVAHQHVGFHWSHTLVSEPDAE